MHLFPFNLGDTIGFFFFFFLVLYLVEFHEQWLWIDILYVVSNSDFQNYYIIAMCTKHQLKHGRMLMWLDLDLTCGVAVSKGRWSVGYKVLSLACAKGVIALRRKLDHFRDTYITYSTFDVPHIAQELFPR